MSLPQLDHIGIAVKSISGALSLYRDTLGIELGDSEEVPSQKVKVQFLETGQTRTELLEATSVDSPIAEFISRRGEGLHHIAYRVENLQQSMNQLATAGCRLIYPDPRPGSHGTLINFIHPTSSGGILIELVEYSHDSPDHASGEESGS
ncbi:MAG: methylmalonyl-CoA epimerase [Planctomycetota bacterium]|nr:methylmalonyl-CoA epimerase [Planctomycetota bacterium]